MPIRPAAASDLRPLAALWNQAFPGDLSLVERVRRLEQGRPYGGIEVSWLAEEDGRLLGAFRAYRFTQYLAGAPVSMLGLAGVAVAHDARRRGIGRELCLEAMRIGRERGDAVSVLYPFRPAFYHALGWGLVGRLHAHTFRTRDLPDGPGLDAVRAAREADRSAIVECYERVASRAHGPIRRSDAAWDHHLEAADAVVVHDPGGGSRPRGYLLASFRARTAPQRRLLDVRELVAEDEAARHALHAWIAAQRDQWPRARVYVPPDEPFDLRLADPRTPGWRPARALWFPTARVIRGPMLRVLDVPTALRARPAPAAGARFALTLEVEVHDAQIPENRGPWTLALNGEESVVHPANGSGSDARLETDAPTFAQIYAGELTPTAAARLGRARIEGVAEALDGAFRVERAFWLLDQF